MPAVPVVVQTPVLHLTDQDAGSPVDVSCDVRSLDLSPDQAVTEVKRFCGTVQVPGLLTETVGVDYTVNDDTATRWAPLVGKTVDVEVWTSPTDATPRTFTSFIGFNPGLYGTIEPGEAVDVLGQSMPVLSPIVLGSGTPA